MNDRLQVRERYRLDRERIPNYLLAADSHNKVLLVEHSYDTRVSTTYNAIIRAIQRKILISERYVLTTLPGEQDSGYGCLRCGKRSVSLGARRSRTQSKQHPLNLVGTRNKMFPRYSSKCPSGQSGLPHLPPKHHLNKDGTHNQKKILFHHR